MIRTTTLPSHVRGLLITVAGRWIGRLVSDGGVDPPSAAVTAGVPGDVAPAADGGRHPGVDPHALVAAAFESFEREIHAFALHATRDADAAADVTQEVFLRLLREATVREAPENIRAWCYRVASNLVVTQARRVSIAERWRRIVAGPETVVESPERSALDRERDEAVQEALADMPRDTRAALLLAAHGFAGREIAEAIGRSELATRSMLCRARSQLRSRLAGMEAET